MFRDFTTPATLRRALVGGAAVLALGIGAAQAADGTMIKDEPTSGKPAPAEKMDKSMSAPAMDDSTMGTSKMDTSPRDLSTGPEVSSAEDLQDATVFAANGEKVGEVDKILLGSDGQIQALVVEYGGFLDLGDREVTVPIDQASITKDGVMIDMTRDQLATLPEYTEQ
jgi:sporulation protein YlmC with PRC-barrel domain